MKALESKGGGGDKHLVYVSLAFSSQKFSNRFCSISLISNQNRNVNDGFCYVSSFVAFLFVFASCLLMGDAELGIF